MDQAERRNYLIEALLRERGDTRARIPAEEAEQKQLLRGLMNVRMPAPIGEDFLAVQDEYLQEENASRGIVTPASLGFTAPGLYTWQGDITCLAADAIVNAANSGMTGCYRPCHNCIDNCIHTYAGIRLRNFCADIMTRQGYEEPTGQARITPGFSLPCRYVLHTVGPIVDGPLTAAHEKALASCYRSCLTLAAENGVRSLAFCCISTGVFGFPKDRAAEIAVRTVREAPAADGMIVIFNVHNAGDFRRYKELLCEG